MEVDAPVAPAARSGAQYLGGGKCRFGLWAPRCRRVDVRFVHPFEKTVPLQAGADGIFHAVVDGVEPGMRYLYVLDGGTALPDPASYYQPEGCRGPSEIVDPAFSWSSAYWCGVPLQDYIIYELHIGTFTAQGTFDAAIERLKDLRALGVTAVEIMPVAQFPGTRNWGYDGVYPYAVQNSYGGPAGLKRFVDACHELGLAAVLDVVYNHTGPDGGSLDSFGPYFTDRYRSPWGPVFNFDGPDSGGVRRFFLDNVRYWLEEFRFDALRLDAVSAIYDASPRPFLQELGEAVDDFRRRTNRLVYTLAETQANDSRFVRPREMGGLGLDAQWSFDFHHSLHALLTGEDAGYYADYGRTADLAKAFREGFVYTGQHSRYWRRRHGSPAEHISARKLIVYAQNHDETGNRPGGERFGSLLSFAAQKLAAGCVLLSPYVPLLFMGEEYGETAPFQFFVDPENPAVGEQCRAGREREALGFGWPQTPQDPREPEIFAQSKLQWQLRGRGRHQMLLAFYRELIRLRREHPVLKERDKGHVRAEAVEAEKLLTLQRTNKQGAAVFAAFHFGDVDLAAALPVPVGNWRRLLDSTDTRWGGAGCRAPQDWNAAKDSTLPLAPKSFVLYEKLR
ncbi:MAG: malto-oligosyltrehalose trehalohydrolase [Elusimicrobiota bacterium]